MRWENEIRWYSAEISSDLFGPVIIQRWGGKNNHHHGMKTMPVNNLDEAMKYLGVVHQQRLKHGYSQVL